MSDKTWSPVEGMIIANELDPTAIEKFLAERNIVAQLEWYKDTPQMTGIRVAIDGGKVATIVKPGEELEPGPTLIDLVESLAKEFIAEVMIGDLGIDRLPEGDLELPEVEANDDGPLRIVEIGSTPSSAVPLMAALEGVDIASIELPDGKRALIAELPADRQGWYFGEVPLVTLTESSGEFQAFLTVDDDPENVITYNWGMEEKLVVGAFADDPQVISLAQNLVGSRSDIQAIHDAVPGVDSELAFMASQERGANAVKDFVGALGLPQAVADFLLGRVSVADLGTSDDIFLHYARGISNALGRSVDIMLNERNAKTNLWAGYAALQARKPWLVPAISATDVAIGATLLAVCRRRGAKRSWAKRLGTAAGFMFLIDSMAQLSFAKYAVIRAEKENE